MLVRCGRLLTRSMDMERLLTIDEVAELLRVSPRTVRRLIARRGLPHFRFGRVVRCSSGDLFRWLQARKEV